MYVEIHCKFKILLKKICGISPTTNVLSSNAVDNYINLTNHIIKYDFVITRNYPTLSTVTYSTIGLLQY